MNCRKLSKYRSHEPHYKVAGKMRLVRPPVSTASVSSNSSKPIPSCNQNHRRDPDLNPLLPFTIPNQNCISDTCPVHLCLITSLTITLTNSNQSKPFLWHSRCHILEPIPNPNPTLNTQDASYAGECTRAMGNLRTCQRVFCGPKTSGP